MEPKEKKAFEPSGLVPRSIVRTFERFRQQLLPGSETAAIREYRISRYQVLVSARCLFTLLIIPIATNWFVSSWLLSPLVEHFWNTQQNEIFLNSYQEERAFAELESFSEKLFFESLLNTTNTINVDFTPSFDRSETSGGLCEARRNPSYELIGKLAVGDVVERQLHKPLTIPSRLAKLSKEEVYSKTYSEGLAKQQLVRSSSFISSKECTLYPKGYSCFASPTFISQLLTPQEQQSIGARPQKTFTLTDCFASEGKEAEGSGVRSFKAFIRTTSDSVGVKALNLFYPSASFPSDAKQSVNIKVLRGNELALQNYDPLCKARPFQRCANEMNGRGKELEAEKLRKSLAKLGIKVPSLFNTYDNLINYSTPYFQGVELRSSINEGDNPSTFDSKAFQRFATFTPCEAQGCFSRQNVSPQKAAAASCSETFCFASPFFALQGKTFQPPVAQHYVQQMEDELAVGALHNAPSLLSPYDNSLKIKEKVQNKILELAIYYNQQTIISITNIVGDVVSLITLGCLFIWMKPEITILKSFLIEAIYSLSDTTKSFLLILLTDLLVGFHSPRGWETALELLLKHFGLPENQDFVFLFVATFPVLLDTVFKYWIFRHLNKISPSTVATYHSMIE